MRIRSFTGIIIVAIIALSTVQPVIAQKPSEYIRKGNRLYNKSEYAGSEGLYRKALDDKKSGSDAEFNLGDALYRQGRYGESSGEFSKTTETTADTAKQAENFYNLGNSLLKEQKFSESINAYINSLKLRPDNMQAKYNLAYAQDQLKQQQEKEKQQQQDQNKDQEKQKDEDKKDENQNKNDKQQNQQDQNQQQQQQQPQTMSRDDAKRLLDALAANEKNTQDKVQKDKAAKARVRVIKNW